MTVQFDRPQSKPTPTPTAMRHAALGLLLMVSLAGPFIAAQATTQVGDRLRHDGRTLYMEIESPWLMRPARFPSPLEWYFELGHPRPEFDRFSTGFHRGYEAIWQIEDGRLYLVGINASRDGRPLALADINPKWGERVVATWFSGKLLVTDFEKNAARMTIEIRNGRVVQSAVLERSPKTSDESSPEKTPKSDQ